MIASALSLAPSDLVTGQGLPRVVSCGLPFLLVRLASRAALARARLNRSVWMRQLEGGPAAAVFLFTDDPDEASPGPNFRARMFAPADGIEEDPATGSAAAALGGWLGSTAPTDGTIACVITQGVEMGRPSRLEVEVERAGAEVAVRVGGAAVLIADGTIEVPVATVPTSKRVLAARVLTQGVEA